MLKFPGYGFPFQYYRPYSNKYHAPIQKPSAYHQTVQQNSSNFEKKTQAKSENNNPAVIDLFGLKLYFDDILILSLLFFLYEEQVKDEILFLALVLLLIS